MRRLIYLLIRIILVAVMLVAIVKNTTFLKWMEKVSRSERLYKEALISSKTFVLTDTNKLSYAIPTFSDQLRLLFTANIFPSEANATKINNIRFTIHYTFFDKKNNIIFQKDYHFKTAHIPHSDVNGTIVPIYFYEDETLIPTASQTLPLYLNNFPKASKISLSIAYKDPIVKDIGVRSYYIERVLEDRTDVLWERMSVKERTDEFDGNIYPLLYITDEEKSAKLSANWRPVGPLEAEGKEYFTRVLIKLRDISHLSPLFSYEPNFYSNSEMNASIVLQEGNYTLEMTPLDGGPTAMTILQLPETLHHINLEQTTQSFPIEINSSGMLILSSIKPVGYEIHDQNRTKNTIDSTLISYEHYAIDHNLSLSYSFHVPSKRLVQIEARSASKSSQTKLSIDLLDHEGKRLQTLTYPLLFTPSHYDYLAKFIPQSEPVRFTLSLDAKVHTIRFTAKDACSIKLFSRGLHHPFPLYPIRRDWAKEEEVRSQGWFSMRPDHFYYPDLRKRQHPIYIQARPPATNPYIQTGNYQYEQLFPLQPWQGFEMLLKRTQDDDYLRLQSMGSVYAKLPDGNPQTIRFKNDLGFKSAQPELIYKTTDTSDTNRLHLTLNKSVAIDTPLYGKTGKISLPPISIGEPYRVAYSTSQQHPIDLYLSHLSLPDRTYIKRIFFAFQEPLRFSFVKKSRGEESLGFWLAADTRHAASGEIACSLKIDLPAYEMMKPYGKLTFTDYRLQFRPTNDEVFSLTDHKADINVSEPILLTLGENIPPGTYTMTLTPPYKETKGLYLYVSHTLLNQIEKPHIGKERY